MNIGAIMLIFNVMGNGGPKAAIPAQSLAQAIEISPFQPEHSITMVETQIIDCSPMVWDVVSLEGEASMPTIKNRVVVQKVAQVRPTAK